MTVNNLQVTTLHINGIEYRSLIIEFKPPKLEMTFGDQANLGQLVKRKVPLGQFEVLEWSAKLQEIKNGPYELLGVYNAALNGQEYQVDFLGAKNESALLSGENVGLAYRMRTSIASVEVSAIKQDSLQEVDVMGYATRLEIEIDGQHSLTLDVTGDEHLVGADRTDQNEGRDALLGR